MARKIKVRPWNLRKGDVLDDGRIVSRVSMVYGSGLVIMQNGPAIHFDRDSESVVVRFRTSLH